MALASEGIVRRLGFSVEPLPWGVVILTMMDPEGVGWDGAVAFDVGVGVGVEARRG
jgi:hypothetical protein